MKLILATAMLAFAAAPALAASPIEGSWANPKRSVTVRIAPCGGDTLCGRVTSASAQARADAQGGGTAALVGTELMSGIVRTGPTSWQGTIFVPDVNRSADAQLQLIGPRALLVQGCALGGMLCKSQQWTRVGPAPANRRHKR